MPGSVAPLVAGWQRRMGSLAGPLGAPSPGGSGDSPSGAAVQVEMYLGGLWVDITSLVMVRDDSGAVSITRGTPNEGGQVVPASCRFQLNNRDGRFSPRNPVSPYYGLLNRNTPLRVSVPLGNVKDYRFWGEVASFPQKWDTTGTDVWVELEAAGILRRLGQGSESLRSTLYRALTSPTLTYPPVAYWPCEDASGSTSIASGLGGTPMIIVGAPSLASSQLFVASDSLPVMADGLFTGRVAAYPVTGQTQVRFLLGVPASGTTDGAVICQFTCSGTAQTWEMYYKTGGLLGLRAFNASGGSVGDTTGVAFNVNGLPKRVSIALTQSGADVVFQMSTLDPGAFVGDVFGGTFTGATVGSVNHISMSTTRTLTSVTLGHVSLETVITSIFDFGVQLNAYIGELAGDRIVRLCGENGVSASSSSGSVAMGAQRPGTLTALIQECVDADLGTLYEPRDSLGLGYRTRALNYNQPPNIALSYSGFNLSQIPEPIDDDRYTRNDVTVVRTGGSSARATLDVGSLSTLQPPAGVGRYAQSSTINIQSDSELANQAGWRLHLATVDEARYPVLAVNLAHASFVANPSLRAQALQIDMGWRMTMTDLPSFLPPDTVSQIVLGSTETINKFQHRITWVGSPESPYRIAVADSPTLGRVDTDGSTLSPGAGPADTTLSVATTGSFALWTTDPTDYPFDLSLGGERVTAYAVGQALGTVDGSFETGVTGWTATACTLVQSSDFAYRGSFSGLITVTGSPTQSFVRPDTTHDATVTVGQSYRCSLWVYSVAGYSNVTAAIDWRTSAHAAISTSASAVTVVPAGVWTLISVTAAAPATAAFARFGPTIAGSPPTGTAVYLDDVFFVATSSYLTSPQSFTVARSVNGVVKAQTPGTDVRLFQPAIAAL